MRAACLLLLINLFLVFGTLNPDIINIGPLIAYPIGNHPVYRVPGVGESYEDMLDPPFDSHGAVNLVFFRDNTAKQIRNCVRVVGGKRSVLFPVSDLSVPLQQSRWIDSYYCHSGLQYFTASKKLGTLRFGVYNNGFDQDTDPYLNPPYFRGSTPDGKGSIFPSWNSGTTPQGISSTFLRTPQVNSVMIQMDGNNTSPSTVQTQFVQNKRWNPFSNVIELAWARDPPPASQQIKGFGSPISGGFSVSFADDPISKCQTMVPNVGGAFVPLSPSYVFDGLTDIRHYCLQEYILDTATDAQQSVLSDDTSIWRAVAFINFQSQCYLTDDYYSFACLDPSRHTSLANEWVALNGRSKRLDLFQTITELSWENSVSFLANYSTVGYLQYQSWNRGMAEFALLNNHIPKQARDKVGIADGPTLKPSQISLWSILYSYKTDPDLSRRWATGLSNPLWKDSRNGWAVLLGRADPVADAFMMICPTPTHSHPGVNYTSPCNAGVTNGNACADLIGRCFCDPNWLGIACDIPRPPGSTYQQLTSDPSDPYEICSTAGTYTTRVATFKYPRSFLTSDVETFADVPICSCIQGFEGDPIDFKSWVPVYASLFHQVMTATASLRNGPPQQFFRTDTWFAHITTPSVTDLSENLVSYSDVWTRLPIPSKPYGIKFDWFWYVMTHQCLIWTQSALIPPMHVWWDYFSFPFLDDEPTELQYQFEKIVFPWPAISTTRRKSASNSAADGRKGVRCMDYRESVPLFSKEWSDFTGDRSSKEYPVATFLIWQQKNATFWAGAQVQQATLYGGPFCTPCPDCNRRNSVCVQREVVYQCDCDPSKESCPIVVDGTTSCDFTHIPTGCIPGLLGRPCRLECQAPCRLTTSDKCVRDGTSYHKNCTTTGPNICQCDDNFCGPTCDTPMCPVSRGSICGNGTCVIDPSKRCENLAPGEYGGFCKCNPGFNGTDCSNPICPLSPSGVMCSGNPCNEQLGLCECPEMTAGPACELKGCPWANGSECAGAQRQDGGGSVCNRETQLCECFRTYQLSMTDSKNGWPVTDSRILLNARWGERCEYTFGDACRDPRDGSWCSQPIDALGDLVGASDAYAGCYNETCDGTGAGESCKPYCHCTLEFATNDPYCRKSVCGPERCGKGVCSLDCLFPGSSQVDSACTVPEVLAGKRTLDAKCVCGLFNDTYYYHTHSDPDQLASCNDPAPLCYTGSTSPCNSHGECAYNATSGTHFCICDSGFTGANCSVAPECLTPLGAACIGASRFCSKDNGDQSDAVCTCAPQYFRDINRTCTTERCVATGGTPTSNGCNCPESRLFYSDPPLERIETTHNKLGCRKGCPLYEGIPCGAYLSPTNSSRCSDLMANDPIFWDDPRPAPNCSCFFRGRDHMGHLNYWIPDPDTGACRPKCYPEGLCDRGQCPLFGNTLNDDNSCNCAPGFEGENCTDHKCPPGHSHHMGDGVCMCMSWCRSGDSCEIDLCQATGGKCLQRGNDCQCSEVNPVLKLDSSSRLSQRFCTSACTNGGVLDPTNTSCICPSPYYGQLCQLTQGCNVQWTGTFCNISNCVNGTPLPNDQSGCVCSDSYYRGVLCDQDLCTIANRRQRVSGNCTCALSYISPDCTDPCLPGGTLDIVSDTCSCFSGYTWNGTACQPPVLNCSGVGSVVSTLQGGQQCICPQEYSGSNCELLTCLPPFVSSGRNRCSCPAGSYGSDCSENYCDSLSIGYNSTLGVCVCPIGYHISDFPDGAGVRQCVPDPYYCSMFGTHDWSNISNPLPCRCKPEWSGTHCSSYAAIATQESSSLSPVVVWSIGGGVVVVIVLAVIIGVVFCRSSSQIVATKSRHGKGMY